MKETTLYKISGIVMITAVVLAISGQISIETNFDWEGQSMAEVLRMYQAGGSIVQLTWIVFGLGAFLIIPTALLLHKVFNTQHTPLLYIGTTFGVISGFSYVLGIMRWVLLANTLSAMYVDPATSESARQTLATLFQAFNVYAGNSFGETIAPLSHAVWVIFLGTAMLKSRICWRWMAWAQILGGIVIALRPLEYAGFRTLAMLSDRGMMLWAVILLIQGVILLTKQPNTTYSRCEEFA